MRTVELPKSICRLLVRKTRLRSLPQVSYFTSLSAKMETVNTTKRLESLRKLMNDHKVDIYGEY